MKTLWLLYAAEDYAVNQDFAKRMQEAGRPLGLLIETVLLHELSLGVDGQGNPFVLRNGQPDRPHGVLSRQRSALVSEHFERMGIPVFNSARVCAICNDKRVTHHFLQGLPMPDTVFLDAHQSHPPAGTAFPVVIKPACSHGGDRVQLVENEREWLAAASAIWPEPALQQEVVTEAGRDLRVYVLHGQIVASVIRTAQHGIVSNFKKGGSVALHTLTQEERQLAEQVIRRFEEAGAPLVMAGVDLLYHHGRPVVGEVEDVVGSRMLYQTSDFDIIPRYLEGIATHPALMV